VLGIACNHSLILTLAPSPNLSFVLPRPNPAQRLRRNCYLIIHQASSIVPKGDILADQHESALIGPAVLETTNILKAAAKALGVKCVVIASSVMALVDAKSFFAEDAPLNTV